MPEMKTIMMMNLILSSQPLAGPWGRGLELDFRCPHCLLSPCVINKPPSWLRGSASSSLGNATKRFKLYKKFWSLLNQHGIWNHPE
jgi:hypothetical protein